MHASLGPFALTCHATHRAACAEADVTELLGVLSRLSQAAVAEPVASANLAMHNVLRIKAPPEAVHAPPPDMQTLVVRTHDKSMDPVRGLRWTAMGDMYQ